jgi:hypothetical protein
MLTARAQAEAQIDTPGAAPATPDKAQPAATKIIVGIVTLAAIAVYFAVFHDRLARDDTFDSPSDEHIRAAKDAVRALMRDPDSVTFGHISRCTGDHVMLTGTYNAKNGFGAYSGSEPFVYDRGTAIILGPPSGWDAGARLLTFERALERCAAKQYAPEDLPVVNTIEGWPDNKSEVSH